MTTLDEGTAREIARAISRLAIDRRVTWLVVEELSKSSGRPDGFTRQWLQANPTIKRAYLKKKAAQRGTTTEGSKAREVVSEVDRLHELVSELRQEIAERDLLLDHFCDVLLRMMRNAVDNGKMTREALMADLPKLVRRGTRTGTKEAIELRSKAFALGR